MVFAFSSVSVLEASLVLLQAVNKRAKEASNIVMRKKDSIENNSFWICLWSTVKLTLITAVAFNIFGLKAQIADSSLLLNQYTVIAPKIQLQQLLPQTSDSSFSALKQHATIDELFSRLAGTYTKIYGSNGSATPSVRGMAAHHTQILWEGVAINSSSLGTSDLSLIPASLFQEINLKYGAWSMSDAQGGLGASLLLSSDPKAAAPLEISYQTGAYGLYKAGLSARWGDRYSGRVQLGGHWHKNDFKYNSTSGELVRQKPNDLRRLYGMFDQVIPLGKLGKQELIIRAWGDATERALAPSMINVDQNEFLADDNLRGMLEWRYGNRRHTHAIKLASLWNHQLYQNEQVGIADTNRVYRQVLDYRSNWYINSIWQWSNGLNYTHDNAVIDAYEGNVRQHSLAWTSQVHIRPLSNLEINLLSRQLYIDDRWAPYTPSLQILWGISPSELSWRGHVHAAIARDFRYPTFNERYWQPYGDPDILPERALQFELGWKISGVLRNKNLYFRLDLDAYWKRVNDWIVWLPSLQNLERVLSGGGELGLQIGKQKKGSKNFLSWRLNNSYAFNRTREKGSGHQLIYVPLHQLNSMIQLSWRGFDLEWTSTVYGKRFYTSDNSLYLSPNHVAQVGLGKSILFGKGTNKYNSYLHFQIDNLFNQQYYWIVLRPMPKRVWRISWSLKIGASNQSD